MRVSSLPARERGAVTETRAALRLVACPPARSLVSSLAFSLTRSFARVVARPLLVNSYGELLIRGGVCVRKNRRWLEERKVGGRGRGREIDA